MDKIRSYGVALLTMFVLTLVFAILQKDTTAELTFRLVFMFCLGVPTLMIMFGGSKK